MNETDQQALIAACFACGEAEALLLAGQMKFEQFAHQQIIARRGDDSALLYLVLEGRISADLFGIDGQYAQLAGYGPGEIFGAYPEIATHRADMTARGATSLLAIGVLQLVELAGNYPVISRGLNRLFARQIDILLDRMSSRIGLSATGRCYQALLSMADNEGWIRPTPVLAAIAVTVNTTRETASRSIAPLVRRGIIEKHDEGFRIVSRRMLEEMVV